MIHKGTVSKNIFTGVLKLVLWYQPHPYFRCGSRQTDDTDFHCPSLSLYISDELYQHTKHVKKKVSINKK